MKIYKVILFLTAISQIAFTSLTNFAGGNNFNQLLITPAGYTFSIWGLIITFSSLYAFWHLFFDKHTYSKKFYLLLSFVYVCFTLWLLAAERENLPITLAIFVAMYASLLTVFKEGAKEFSKNLWTKVFLQGGMGAYIAWSSIAVVINVGVYLFSFGIESISQTGVYLQILLVVAATLSAAYTLYRTNFNKIVFATHWWAFVGLLVGLYSRENTGSLLVVSLLCVIAINIYFFIGFKKKNKKIA